MAGSENTKNVAASRNITGTQPLVFAPGARVKAGISASEGILLEQTKKGVWQVQFGSVKMQMK